MFLDIFLWKQSTNCLHSLCCRGYWLPSELESSKSCAVNTSKPQCEALLLHCTILKEIQRFQEEKMRLRWSLAQMSRYLWNKYWKWKKELHKVALAESLTFKCFKNASEWVHVIESCYRFGHRISRCFKSKFSWYYIPLLSDRIAVLTMNIFISSRHIIKAHCKLLF